MKKELVLVYQMGKVGSSSIYQSLKKNKNIDAYHIHTLNKRSIKSIEERSIQKDLKIEQHIFDSKEVLKKYFDEDLKPKVPIKIITLVREPISRNFAAYFQNLDIFHIDNPVFKSSFTITKEGIQKCRQLNLSKKLVDHLLSLEGNSFDNSQHFLRKLKEKIEPKIVNNNKFRILRVFNNYYNFVDELISDFLNSYSHAVPFNWFDKEYKEVLGIDVFASKFPRLKGHIKFENTNIECLILKLDINDKLKEKLIIDFLGLKNFKIKNTNFGDDKYYGASYQEFKKQISLPVEYVNKMVASQYTKHFYNPEQRQQIRAKWNVNT